MLARRRFVALSATAAAVVLAGCATTRSELSLPAPGSRSGPGGAGALPPLTGKVAVIRSVTDERVFEDKPSDPSTPSLGFGGASQATDEIKRRAFGRKRGGFGQAFGDVLLQEGQSVTSVVRDNLAAALRQAGIQVVDAASAPPTALQIDVRVKAFWSWINPGFWALTANGRIQTELDITGAAGTRRVAIEHHEPRQIMTEGAWLEVMGKALELYRAEATKLLGPLASA